MKILRDRPTIKSLLKPTERDNENDEKAAYVFGVGKHGGSLISLMNIAGVIVEKDKEKSNA